MPESFVDQMGQFHRSRPNPASPSPPPPSRPSWLVRLLKGTFRLLWRLIVLVFKVIIFLLVVLIILSIVRAVRADNGTPAKLSSESLYSVLESNGLREKSFEWGAERIACEKNHLINFFAQSKSKLHMTAALLTVRHLAKAGNNPTNRGSLPGSSSDFLLWPTGLSTAQGIDYLPNRRYSQTVSEVLQS